MLFTLFVTLSLQIFTTLYAKSVYHSETETTDEEVNAKRLSTNSQSISDKDVARLAFQCLKQLFRMSNGTNVRLALTPAFAYMDETEKWWPRSFPVSLIMIIAGEVQ